jgi:hypothetical protein
MMGREAHLRFAINDLQLSGRAKLVSAVVPGPRSC